MRQPRLLIAAVVLAVLAILLYGLTSSSRPFGIATPAATPTTRPTATASSTALVLPPPASATLTAIPSSTATAAPTATPTSRPRPVTPPRAHPKRVARHLRISGPRGGSLARRVHPARWTAPKDHAILLRAPVPTATTAARPSGPAAPTRAPVATYAPPTPTATPRPLFNPWVPSAQITVPRLGVAAPVYDRGIDSTRHLPIATGYAVTHYFFSAALGQAGNYVIYGHDDIDGSIFRYLPNMQVGDRVYFRAGARQYVYQVTGTSIVLPTDVSVLAPTAKPTLTMISCTPYWVDTQRIIVKAALVGTTN